MEAGNFRIGNESHFLLSNSRKGCEELLEALEKIQLTEEVLKDKKQTLLAEIQQYPKERTAALEKQKLEDQQQLQRLIEENEAQEQEKLTKEAQRLQLEASKQTRRLEEQYVNHRQEAIQKIIERVKKQYGCH